jgi:diacylglycerol kinase (ATP)
MHAMRMKNRKLVERIGFALAGIRIVVRREKSFRTQLVLAGAAVAALLALQPGLLWSAIILVAIGLVLALEMANAALEYLIDYLHPELAAEIGHAKDAAAGAVLLASFAAAGVGAMMLLSSL